MTFRCRQTVLFKLLFGVAESCDQISFQLHVSYRLSFVLSHSLQKKLKNNESKVFGESSTPESNIMQCTVLQLHS